MGNGRQARQDLESRSCFVLFSLLACLGCLELASTTVTSTPRSVDDVEVSSISNLLVYQGKGKAEYCQ